MPCRYCGQNRKLVEAHILPRSFYKHLRTDGDIPIVVPHADDEYIQKSHTGVYDREILCEVCEPKFGDVDGYGKRFFLDTDWEAARRHPELGERLIEIRDADNRLLKLFVLSVLLRAHWTTQSFFAHVDIGRHEHEIKDMLERGDAGDQSRYGVVIFKFRPTGSDVDPRLGWRNPAEMRSDGIRFWNLWFLDFRIAIKVDQRPLLEPFTKFALNPGKEVRVLMQDYMSSRELQAILSTTRAREDADSRRRRRG